MHHVERNLGILIGQAGRGRDEAGLQRAYAKDRLQRPVAAPSVWPMALLMEFTGGMFAPKTRASALASIRSLKAVACAVRAHVADRVGGEAGIGQRGPTWRGLRRPLRGRGRSCGRRRRRCRIRREMRECERRAARACVLGFDHQKGCALCPGLSPRRVRSEGAGRARRRPPSTRRSRPPRSSWSAGSTPPASTTSARPLRIRSSAASSATHFPKRTPPS